MKKTAKKPRTITISDEPSEITADFDSLEPFDSDKIFEELDNDFFQLEKQLDEMDLSELDNFELPELDLSDIEIFKGKRKAIVWIKTECRERPFL